MTKLDQAILEDGSPSFIALELLVDRVGLRNVLYALALIAHYKAEHIRTNWPEDKALARCWEADAKMIEKVKLWTPV